MTKSLSQNSLCGPEAERKPVRQGGRAEAIQRRLRTTKEGGRRASTADEESRACSRPKPRWGFGIGSKSLSAVHHVFFALSAGCFAHTTSIRDLDERGSLEVRLDANARALAPGQDIRFLVDLLNQTSSWIDLKDLKVELLVCPENAPETVSFRHSWSFNWGRAVFLEPKKKITLPLVREKAMDLAFNEAMGCRSLLVEFPLEHLSPGNYTVVALVNGRHASKPCPLRIVRPDLESWLPSTKPGPSS